jgi:hypothetical protein
MKTQIIQLENHDDLISARDKMAWSKAPRILLIWPRKGKLLERSVDLLILQRYAQSLGAQMGVVTDSMRVQGQSRELGIPCFQNLARAQRQTWRRSRGRKRLNLHLLERKQPTSGLRERFSQINSARKVLRLNNWLRAGVFSLGVAAVLFLAFIFWPSARIEISPARQDQLLQLELHASPSIHEANPSGGLPAILIPVVVEGYDQERSSGRIHVPAEQATGVVEISNLGETELIVPAGTVVSTTGANPQRYETVREARIPAGIPAGIGGKHEVDIRALVPGTQGNTGAGTIEALEGAIGLAATVNNPQPVTGGTDRISPGPTTADYTALRERLAASLRATAIEDLKRNLGTEKRLLEGTIVVSKVISESMDPQPDQPGDYARLTMQVEFSAWYVREEDLQAVAKTSLDANPVPGYQPDGQSIAIQFSDQPAVFDPASVRWNVTVGRRLQAMIDMGHAARSIVGVSPEKAKAVLENAYPLRQPVQIELSPAWWFRLPFLSFRIVMVEQ